VPSFDASFTRGVTIEPLEDDDHPDGSQPGRLNPRSAHGALHARTTPGTMVQVTAHVFGLSDPPPDSELGGFLFEMRMLEWPFSTNGGQRPQIYNRIGWSAIQSFVAFKEGHYTVCVLRGGGKKGRFILHVDCEP